MFRVQNPNDFEGTATGMADETTNSNDTDEDEGGSVVALSVGLAIAGAWLILWLMQGASSSQALQLATMVAQVSLISVVIWQVCDPFADAAQWVGIQLHLPGSIRGATLDAVASSMPELFAGIFFVVVAISDAVAGVDGELALSASIAAGSEGFGSTIATCAGSAVYNMILIPAFCGLVISWSRPERPTVDIEDEVISRDGLWFVACQILLIMFLYEEQMMWWMGLCLLAVYSAYITTLYLDARRHRVKVRALREYMEEHGCEGRVRDVMAEMREQHGLRVSAVTIMKAQQDFEASNGDDEDEEDDTAGVFFGFVQIPLNVRSAIVILTSCMLIAAAACYFLVEATIETAKTLEVPAFFIAVIVAAAASSVPDTFLAIAAARRGDDSGAVSNAFGSNIFDICICVSIPLLLNSWLTGWEPVSLLKDGKPMPGLQGLRILLVTLTVVNLMIMWQNRQITRKKAYVMCGLYLIFVGYAVLGSLGYMS